jgi:hypothetical protein
MNDIYHKIINDIIIFNNITNFEEKTKFMDNLTKNDIIDFIKEQPSEYLLKIKRKVWKHKCKNGVKLNVLCNNCGGVSRTICKCSRRNFMKSFEANNIINYIKPKRTRVKI